MGELGKNGTAPMSFDIAATEDGSVVVTVGGELDISNIDRLASAVEPLQRDQPRRLIIDVASLRFADSSAIAQWVQWAAVFEDVTIRDASVLLRRVISSMGLLGTLHLAP